MKKKEKIDVGTPEAKEMLLNFVKSIQIIDDNIKVQIANRKNTLDLAKDAGFTKTMINKAITEIRKELDADEAKVSEEEIYYTLIKESNVIQSVKV